MGIFGKWTRPKRDYLIWSNKRQLFEMVKLTWRPGIAEDSFLKKAWELSPDLKTYGVKLGRKIIPVNILDEETGVGLNIEVDPGVLRLKTNSDLAGQLIDAAMLTAAMQLTPSRKQIIIGGLVGLLIGLLFGAGM